MKEELQELKKQIEELNTFMEEIFIRVLKLERKINEKNNN